MSSVDIQGPSNIFLLQLYTSRCEELKPCCHRAGLLSMLALAHPRFSEHGIRASWPNSLIIKEPAGYLNIAYMDPLGNLPAAKNKTCTSDPQTLNAQAPNRHPPTLNPKPSTPTPTSQTWSEFPSSCSFRKASCRSSDCKADLAAKDRK